MQTQISSSLLAKLFGSFAATADNAPGNGRSPAENAANTPFSLHFAASTAAPKSEAATLAKGSAVGIGASDLAPPDGTELPQRLPRGANLPVTRVVAVRAQPSPRADAARSLSMPGLQPDGESALRPGALQIETQNGDVHVATGKAVSTASELSQLELGLEEIPPVDEGAMPPIGVTPDETGDQQANPADSKLPPRSLPTDPMVPLAASPTSPASVGASIQTVYPQQAAMHSGRVPTMAGPVVPAMGQPELVRPESAPPELRDGAVQAQLFQPRSHGGPALQGAASREPMPTASTPPAADAKPLSPPAPAVQITVAEANPAKPIPAIFMAPAAARIAALTGEGDGRSRASSRPASPGRGGSLVSAKVAPSGHAPEPRLAERAGSPVKPPAGDREARQGPAPQVPLSAVHSPPAEARNAGDMTAAFAPLSTGMAPLAPPPVAANPALAGQVHADIAALVDRLVAAREMVASAQAALSIENSDFGAIDLRFEQDRAGQLAVELSSADPELRRVVATAPTVEAPQPARASGEAQGAAQHRFSGGGGANTDTASHSQGERRGETPRHNPEGRRQRDGTHDPGNEDGIFA